MKISPVKVFLLGGVAVSSLLLGVAAAQAGAFALREQSAQGLGESFAGVAAGAGGLSSMFWNPATITKTPGWQSQWNVSGIIPYAKITPSAATSGLVTLLNGGNAGASGGTGDVAQDAIIPASYSSYQWNDYLWFGLQMGAPYGLATTNPNAWAGQVYGRTSKVTSFEVTPTIGVRITDWLSIGAGVRVMNFKVRLTSAAATSPVAPGVELRGQDWAVGWTAGLTLTPFAGTEIGLGYRSQMKPELEGQLTTPAGATNIKSKITLPDMVTVGLRQRINDQWTFLATYEWTHWSVFNFFPVTKRDAPGAGTVLTNLDFKYRNGWFASVGGEYRWNPNLTLRAGLGYERSPIDDASRGVRLADNDRIWTSIGASYQWNQKISFDVSYAHLFPKSTQINVVAGNPAFRSALNPGNPALPFQASVKSHVDIIAVALNFRWDDPKVVEPGLPIVRKY